MEDSNHKAGAPSQSQAVKRFRASGPILLLAILFVVGAFLSWYFSWFGRDLSDADISQYLVDDKHPRRVQHALLQVQQRIERGDPSAKQWYPQVINLAAHPETEFRLTVAWLMGFDNTSPEFHQTLSKLVKDPEPIVRRNAALALVRFNDSTGRAELLAALAPYELKAPVEGQVASTLKAEAEVVRGTLLGRINQADKTTVEVRSPLPGKVANIVSPSGTNLRPGDKLLTIDSDEDSIWEALRGLSLIGTSEDLPAIERYSQNASTQRIKEQAVQTANAIRKRAGG